MAETPTPRSYAQILGKMIATFVSKSRVSGMKVGGPILNILETAAQSDTRGTQETFSLLAANSLEKAEGTALDRHARDEGTRRFGATFTTGVVTLGDSRFSKAATTLNPGSPAPIVGSSVLYISSVEGFPLGGGQIYIGRGTSNYEGPLTYTNITGSSAPFAVNLAAGSYTKKFHNTYESVILAQGGNRSVPAGTTVQTPQANSADAVSFSTLYAATILDGEVSVENVAVICDKAGTIGRVIAGAINSFSTPPFEGATVSNPTAFTNGNNVESDRDLKDRLRRLKQSRSKGTDLALQQAVIGVVSENKQVQSASVVSRLGFPTTVYIDDGTGYEELSTGIALESLTDSASGGETDFALASPRPVAKAFVKSTLSAPYAIEPGTELVAYVGGVISRHSFSADQFPNIANASGYDVAAAINANSSLLFGARTADNGKNVILFAKSETAENIQVSTSDADANDVFGFPLARIDTLRLYKNDVLLSKDGTPAIIYGNPNHMWRPMQSGETLTVAVDGTAAQTYTFESADFIAAKTGYTILSHRNSLAAWVAVFNAKIPGITASTDQTGLILTSNAGASSRAKIEITGGTLVSRAMFNVGSDVGANRDYTLNRHTGQIRLMSPLAAGDKLTAGTVASRAFIESSAIKTPINLASAGTLWFFVDSGAQVIQTGITGATTLNIAINTPATAQVKIDAGGTAFANAQVGDWIILWDSALNASNKGAWRVAQATSAYVVVESTTMVTQSSLALTSAGITLVRADGVVQEIAIASNSNYTANSLATQINASIKGAVASVSRTSRLRVTSNTFDAGDIMLAATDSVTAAIPLPVGSLATSNVPQLGVVESGSSDFGTPTFTVGAVSASLAAGAKNPTITGLNVYNTASLLVGLRHKPDGSGIGYSTQKGALSSIDNVSGNVFTLRNAPVRQWMANDRIYAASPFAMGPYDTLNVVVDGDQTAKAFAPAMWRKCSTTGAYGSTINLKDADNGNQSLAVAFGINTAPFNFNDFAVLMKPRVQTHLEDTTKTVLWRYNRMGADGMNTNLVYGYPTQASQSISVTIDPYMTYKPEVSVVLPSGAPITLSGLRSTSNVGSFQVARTGNAPYPYYLIAGLQITKLSRAANGDVTATVIFPDTAMNLNPNPLGLLANSYVYVSPSATGTSFDGTAALRQIKSVSTGAAPYTFVYNDGLTTVETTGDGTTSNIGTMSYDSGGVATWAGVNVGNIVSFTSSTGVPTIIQNQPLKVTSVDANSRWIKVNAQVGGSSSTAISWGAVNNLSNVANFTIQSKTAAEIVAAVNALPNSPVSAVNVGSGTGSVGLATWDEKADLTYKYAFTDGINYVRSYTAPASTAGDYSFTLKATVNSNLAGYNDWVNEEVRLVPITSASIAAFLNSSAVGGLFANGEIRASSQNSKIQLATNTAGSQGSIAVLGGTANSALAAIVGSPGVTGDGLSSYVFVRAPEISGFCGRNYVAIENALPHRKPLTANLSTIAVADGIATFTFASAIRTRTTLSSNTWMFEKQGDYMAVAWNGQGSNPVTTGFAAGDYVTFSGASLSASNTGTFQIVAIDNSIDCVWVKNPKCVEQVVAATLEFTTSGSVMPGDTLVIGGDEWNSANRGSYTVLSVTDSAFTIAGAGIVPVTGPITATGLNQIFSGTGSTLVKRIRSVIQHPTDTSLMVVVFEDAANYNLISSNYGSILKAQDKLAFPTSIYTGTDGYARSVGLVEEAVKVLYGDARDTDTYPGYVASGSNIAVSGPIVRRMNVSVAVRIRGGASTASIFNAVKSAVAAVVNAAKIGQSIPLSDIVTAVSAINGVYAVTILSPTYGNGSDVIPVQPYEKAMILNVDSDVQVTIAGS